MPATRSAPSRVGRPVQTTQRQAAELAVVDRVARELGASVAPGEDPPDAWLIFPSAERVPVAVEVVGAYRNVSAERTTYPPTRGAPAARAETEVERQVRAL